MKRLVALAMALCLLAGILAGCATKPAASEDKPQASKSEVATEVATTEAPTVRLMVSMDSLPDMEMVQEELSRIAMEKAGCKVELGPVPYSNYGQQVNLLVSSSSDPVDIMAMNVYVGISAPPLVAKGGLLPMDDLLEEYGQGAKEALGEYLQAGVINGELYELCSIRNMALQWGIMMPKAMVEKYDIDLDSIKSEDDLAPIFEKVAAAEPNMIMVMPEGGQKCWIDEASYDPLGDSFGVLENRGESLEVVNFVETEGFAESARRHSEWFKKGWISKDILTTTETAWDLIKAGKLFSVITTVKPGVEMEKQIATGGVEMVCVTLGEPFTYTTRASTFGWTIPYNSPNPEAAMKVLNLMYSDEEFLNVLDWGIEGTHYVKVDGYDNVITFPEGVTAETSGYYHGLNWMFGNQYISYVWEGNEPDLYTNLQEWNNSADVSKAMGFVWDYTTVKTEYTAVSNVNEKYLYAITEGVMDYDTYIDEYVQALKNAGIDKIIAEKQAQLDAWAEVNGIN